MNSSLIANVNSNPGMTNLLASAMSQNRQQPEADGLQDGKCHLIRTLLDGLDYYVPAGSGGFSPAPPFPYMMQVAYEPVRNKEGKIDSVTRHESVELIGTGFRVTVVDFPYWWSKRDEGMV